MNYGKTRLVEEPSLYYIVFEYINRKCAIECARSAIGIICSLAENKEIDVDAILQYLKTIAVETELGLAPQQFMQRPKTGHSCYQNRGRQHFKARYGKYSRLIQASTDLPGAFLWIL